MTQLMISDPDSEHEVPAVGGGWVGPLLGLAPTLFTGLASLVYGTHWLASFQPPPESQWLFGLAGVIILALVFVVIAVSVELRRWNARRLIEEIESDEKTTDGNLAAFSQSLRRLDALGVTKPLDVDG